MRFQCHSVVDIALSPSWRNLGWICWIKIKNQKMNSKLFFSLRVIEVFRSKNMRSKISWQYLLNVTNNIVYEFFFTVVKHKQDLVPHSQTLCRLKTQIKKRNFESNMCSGSAQWEDRGIRSLIVKLLFGNLTLELDFVCHFMWPPYWIQHKSFYVAKA